MGGSGRARDRPTSTSSRHLFVGSEMRDHFRYGHDVAVLDRNVIQVCKVTALVLVGDALLRNDDPITARNRVDHRRPDPAGGGSARQHHGVALMPSHQRLKMGFMKGGSHALVDDDVADMVDLEPVVEFGPTRADLDVLK